MKKKTRPNKAHKKARRGWPVLVQALCLLLGALAARQGLPALERLLYPRQYSEYVEYYAARYGVQANQVYAIIRTESGFDPQAESSVGARGLMQITEETFLWLKSKLAPEEDVTFDDLYQPEQNIRFGAYLLSICLTLYDGDLATAAAAYHSGIGLVDSLLESEEYSAEGRTLHTFPYNQMNHYVHKVQKTYSQYQRLYGGA